MLCVPNYLYGYTLPPGHRGHVPPGRRGPTVAQEGSSPISALGAR